MSIVSRKRAAGRAPWPLLLLFLCAVGISGLAVRCASKQQPPPTVDKDDIDRRTDEVQERLQEADAGAR